MRIASFTCLMASFTSFCSDIASSRLRQPEWVTLPSSCTRICGSGSISSSISGWDFCCCRFCSSWRAKLSAISCKCGGSDSFSALFGDGILMTCGGFSGTTINPVPLTRNLFLHFGHSTQRSVGLSLAFPCQGQLGQLTCICVKSQLGVCQTEVCSYQPSQKARYTKIHARKRRVTRSSVFVGETL